MLIKKMGIPWVVVSDIQKAKSFYVDVLGFPVHEEQKEANWLEVTCGDSLLGIWQALPNVPDKPGQNAVLTFVVENIEETKKVLEQKNVRFMGEIVEVPGIFKMITFLDADNNKYQLFQEY